jgi:hypothetical protein
MRIKILGAIVAIMTSTQAMGQVAAAAAPNCALAPGGAGASTATSAVIACVAELDGNGKQNVIVGQVNPLSGYVLILNSTGTVRKKLCWGFPGSGNPCPTITP